jgi:tetratricopeptide (TPR) repeat protein
MNNPRKIGLLLLCLLAFIFNHAQDAAAIDSIKLVLAGAKTPEEKVKGLDNLSRILMNIDLQEAEKYGSQLILVAEESRNRQLMIDAYKSNGLRCSYFGGQKEYTKRAIEYYNKALDIARKEKIEKEVGGIQLNLAIVHLLIPEKDKALNYVNQAFSLISTLSNDSLKAEAHNTYGRVYLSRNDKTLSLRNYLTALRIGEDMKGESKAEKRTKAVLMRNCYLYLSNFYSVIEDYDKAIDYYTLANKKLDDFVEKNTPYQRVIDINSIGNLFAAKKSYDIAIGYFERSIKMADSLHFSTLKIPGYISLLNQYLNINQSQKALEYINSTSGQTLQKYLERFGFSGIVDQVYAVIYTDMNKFDSARIYFNRAIPYFEKSISESNKIGFYRQLATFYKKAREDSKAIEEFLKVKEIGERLGLLENVQDAAEQLDSLYNKNGSYQLASQYNRISYQYKDSIEKLNKEKELTQVEAADELQRLERTRKEQEEMKRRKNNIQYMAIILGIVVLFIALAILGMFKVSAALIKAISFFVFLMLFEFIFLVFKKNIYSITHGEPWKDLAFMIALAALLVPLHHWLEHKVLHYLTSHNRLTSAGHHIKRKLFRRTKEGEQ